MKMFILDDNPNNEFNVELYQELLKYDLDILKGSFDDLVHAGYCDYILLSWPVYNANLNEYVYYLQSSKHRGTKIIHQVHNLIPHVGISIMYAVDYKLTDIFIHMGQYSYDVLINKYPNAQHIIIPHHTYNHTYDKCEIIDPHLDQQYKYILAFGDIRKKSELKLLLNLKDFCLNNNYKILCKCDSTDEHIQCLPNQYLTQSEIKGLFIHSDIVLIPRIDGLNSGNIPLGLYFGKPIIGPDIGNMGYLLKETNNYIWQNQNEIPDLIQLAYNNREKLGQRNKQYAEQNLHIKLIGKKLYDYLNNQFTQVGL